MGGIHNFFRGIRRIYINWFTRACERARTERKSEHQWLRGFSIFLVYIVLIHHRKDSNPTISDFTIQWLRSFCFFSFWQKPLLGHLRIRRGTCRLLSFSNACMQKDVAATKQRKRKASDEVPFLCLIILTRVYYGFAGTKLKHPI
jgi:hypothetical protein